MPWADGVLTDAVELTHSRVFSCHVHGFGQQELPIQWHNRVCLVIIEIKDLHPEREFEICHVLVGVALQQEPTILRYKEDRFQVDGKRDGVNAALKYIQHLQLVAGNTQKHKYTVQWLIPP